MVLLSSPVTRARTLRASDDEPPRPAARVVFLYGNQVGGFGERVTELLNAWQPERYPD